MKKVIFLFVFSVAISLTSTDTFSQCAMCNRVADTGHSNNNSTARGLNKGILYLLTVPYLLGGVGAFVWYKNRKKIS